MKKSKKSLAWIAALLVAAFLVPATVQAEETSYVTVAVRNDTAASAAWTGELFEMQVPLTAGMTAGDALQAACVLAEPDYSATGKFYGTYWLVDEINGLEGAWLVTIDNWACINGTSEPVKANDYISVEYSASGDFTDLRSNFYTADGDKLLMEFPLTVGTLEPAFDPDVFTYVLRLPAGTDSVVLQPQITNRNFQTIIKAGETQYKWTEAIPVTEGLEITFTCGGLSMNEMTYDPQLDQTYTLTVAYDEQIIDDGDITSELDDSADTGDAGADGLMLAGAMVLSLAGAASLLLFRRRTQE